MCESKIARLGAALLAFVFFIGCGKSGDSVFAAHSSLFSSGQLNEDWNAAATALQTNGYVEAETRLFKMRSSDPTAGQLQAINHAIRSINNQLVAAAGKGDLEASNALQELSTIGRTRAR